jgi:glycine cleavage system H protein
MRYFTPSHEWIELSGPIGTVGITDYAQKELGEIVFIELPQVNALLKSGEEVSVLESTKAAADIYTPVSGKVIEVNSSLPSSPSLVNQSAEKMGWLFKIELSHPDELNSLLRKEEYHRLVHSKSE